MTNSQVTQTVFGDHNIFTGIGDINIVYNLPPAEAEDHRNLLILLNKVKQFWIEGVLEQSVYHEAMIQLGKETRPEMVQHPWEKVLELPDRTSLSLPPDKNIREIFEERGKALLILGEPGSGKTITLLELARELISVSENDPSQPIPVVFNLSTWNIKNPPIFDWLVSELSSKYQIPKRFGRPWLGNNRLLLLLDGLDEVDRNQRDRCVKAINEFIEKSGVPGIAVCSRLEEYLALHPIYLKLSGAICLQPLTPNQVNGYLERAGSPLASLRTVLPTDPVLQELAQTPLMLNVMSLAYQNMPVEALGKGKLDTVEGRRKNLFDTYMKRMFERKGNAGQPYVGHQVIEWLYWLASGMMQHSKTIFLVEDLQPSWFLTRQEFWIYAICCCIITGLIFILYSTPVLWFKPKLNLAQKVYICWLLSICLITMAGIRVIRIINILSIYEGLKQKFVLKFKFFLILGIIFGLIIGLLMFDKNGLVFSLIFGLISMIFFVVFLAIIYLFFVGSVISIKQRSNQAISLSIKNVLFDWLILGLVIGILQGTFFVIIYFHYSYLAMSAMLMSAMLIEMSRGIAGILIWWLFGFIFFGQDVIKHYTLRLVLWWKGYAPLNYAKFLDYSTKLIFLRKVGGGYIFIHRMLMEHFAAVGKEE